MRKDVENFEPGSALFSHKIKDKKVYLDFIRELNGKVNEAVNKIVKEEFNTCFFCHEKLIRIDSGLCHTVPESMLKIIAENSRLTDLDTYRAYFTSDVGSIFSTTIPVSRAGGFRMNCNKHDSEKFKEYENESLENITYNQMNQIALKTSQASFFFYRREMHRIEMLAENYGLDHFNLDTLLSIGMSIEKAVKLYTRGELSASRYDNHLNDFKLLLNCFIEGKPLLAMQSCTVARNENLDTFQVYTNVFPSKNGSRVIIFTDSSNEGDSALILNNHSVAEAIVSGIFNMRFTTFIPPSLKLSAENSSLYKILGTTAFEASEDDLISVMNLLNFPKSLSEPGSWLHK